MLDALDQMGLSSQIEQIELAQELCITAASMSTMTARLSASVYIDRRQEPDEKRSNTLCLSTGGVSQLSDIRSAWHSVDRLVEDAVGSKNADTLFEIALEPRDALGGWNQVSEGRECRHPMQPSGSEKQKTDLRME